MDIVPLTVAQVRRIDQLAAEAYGIPGETLMENAGRCVLAVIHDFLHASPSQPSRPVVIICGGGNNGGDGYVIARHLLIEAKARKDCSDEGGGHPVVVLALKDPREITGDAGTHARAARDLGLDIRLIETPAQFEAERVILPLARMIVDAMLGTGFRAPLRPVVAQAIAACNQLRRAKGIPIIAVDLPSGLDADTGEATDGAIEADLTVTFVAPKIGFANPKAAGYLGKVVVGDIGVPPELVARVRAETLL
ncbi:MAG: NAD(P)H-hydrate epimerase [Planctomycetota bacterium]|nr:NAD(P)H-hydrate epimerase [Planctomycetota bacterium]